MSFVGGYSNQWFQIPNPVGQQPSGSWTVGGQSAFPSEKLNETQLEKTGFGQLAFLHDAEPFTVQASLFARYSSLRYRPDVLGELLYNGQAQQAYKQDFAIGGQIDAVYHLGDAHTLRGGLLVTRDRSTSDTTTQSFRSTAMAIRRVSRSRSSTIAARPQPASAPIFRTSGSWRPS